MQKEFLGLRSLGKMTDISIIIPTFNEAKFIEKCLDSILTQDFKSLSYEVIIADGNSQDATPQLLKKYADKYPQIKLMVNEQRYQVYALNQMISAASGKVIVRCDAHAEYAEGYFAFLANYLIEHKDIGNLGSHVQTVAAEDGLVARVVSIALHSKFGVGISHRTMFLDGEKDVDTVLFGAWRKEVFDSVGLFDTGFIRGQDVEHNIRIIGSGLRVVQVAGPKVTYYARNSISKLFNMMKQYASVKPLLYRKHRVFPNIRSFIPLGFFLTLLTSLFAGSWFFLGLLSLYLSVALSFSWYETHVKAKLSFVEWFLLSFCYLVQHSGHAYGMIVGGWSALQAKNIVWGNTR